VFSLSSCSPLLFLFLSPLSICRYSESTGKLIDEEVKILIDEMYLRVRDLLNENVDKVTAVAELLLERETISHDDVLELIGARPFAMDEQYAEYISQKDRTSDEGIASAASVEELDDVEEATADAEAEAEAEGEEKETVSK
jgi:hypothetical protein